MNARAGAVRGAGSISNLRTCRATISRRGARAAARWTTTCRCSAGRATATKVVIDNMAEKKNKEFAPVGIKLRADLAERLERYKAETGANKTFVIEKALERYLDEAAPVDK